MNRRRSSVRRRAVLLRGHGRAIACAGGDAGGGPAPSSSPSWWVWEMFVLDMSECFCREIWRVKMGTLARGTKSDVGDHQLRNCLIGRGISVHCLSSVLCWFSTGGFILQLCIIPSDSN